MPISIEEFELGLRDDEAYLVYPDGRKFKWTGLSTATFVDDKGTQSTDEDDLSPTLVELQSEMEFSFEIQQTNKQSRETRKFFKRVINKDKRNMKRYRRLKEKIRRSFLKGKSIEYVKRQYYRSFYYLGHVSKMYDPIPDPFAGISHTEHSLQ